MFDQLNQNELFEVFFDDIKSERVKNHLNGINSESESLNFIEHCVFLYWKNKIEAKENITNSEIEQLLVYKKYNVYQNVVGELSKNNLLNYSQLKKLFVYLNNTDWGYKQCKARIEINGIKKKRENKDQIDKDFLNFIFHNKMLWAIEEILDYLSKNELQFLYDGIDQKNFFSKKDRKNILQKIKSIANDI